MPEISLSRGYTLIAHGPARVRVLEGSVRIFGATLGAGNEVFAEPTRSLPLHAIEDTKLHVETGSFSLFEGDTIPGEWYSLAETILEEGLKRVMVVGDVDSGKTSLVTLLVNVLASRGRRVAVIDADVGQKSIGPPGTVGLGVTDRQVYTLSSIEMLDAFFIGSNTPSGILHRSLSGVMLLLQKAEKLSDFTLIDTTGWVTDSEGRELKFFKALLTEPDLIVLVGDPGTLAQIERPLKKLFRVVRVPRPRVIFERRREDRREYRRWMYSKYLSGATVKSVDIGSIDMAYAFSFTGLPLTPSEKEKLEGILGVSVLYAERSDDHLGAIVSSQPLQQAVELAKSILGVRHARIISGFELVHSVVGFMSREKYCEGIGVITGFNPRERQISVLTRVDNLSDKLWLLGVQKVNPSSFEEEVGLEKWSI